MQLPLAIPLRRSRRLILLLALAHGAALVALLALPWPWPLRAAAGLVVAVAAGIAIRRAWQSPVAALHLGVGGELEVEMKVGAGDTPIGAATILPQSTVMPDLVVLLLRVGGRRVCLVLPPDATGTEAHRLLRLWLRWRSSSTAN